MMQGFINGIKNMMGNLVNAVKGIGDKIKSFLHFSRPDEGPLRDYEKWMPDMVQGLSKTLNKSAPELYNASKQLAKRVADNLDISSMLDNSAYHINTDFVSSIKDIPTYTTEKDIQPQNIMYDTMRRAIEDTKFHNNNEQSIYLTVNVGNKKLGQMLLDNLRDMTRQTGKDIEALVGG